MQMYLKGLFVLKNDRVRFTNGKLEDMLNLVLTNTIILYTPRRTTHQRKHIKIKSWPDVAANLATKSIHTRKYKNINVGDDVKVFTKGKGNYTSRKETTSRWSDRTYKVVKIDRDITLNTYYVLEGSSRHYNRHELLLIDWVMPMRIRYFIT